MISFISKLDLLFEQKIRLRLKAWVFSADAAQPHSENCLSHTYAHPNCVCCMGEFVGFQWTR